MTARRHVLAGYFIWLTLLIAAYYGLPSLRVEAWGLIGLSGVAGIVAGVVINRPARKAPWLRVSYVGGWLLCQDTSLTQVLSL